MKIFFALCLCLFSFTSSVSAEVERRQIILAVLDSIEQRIGSPKPSAHQNFLSDFYWYNPFQVLIDNLTSFSSLNFYDFDQPVGIDPRLPPHLWELGTEVSYIKYTEPDVMEEEGTMYGIAGSYTSRGGFLSKSFMFKLEGKGSWGQVDYENSGTLDDIDDYMLEFRGLGGFSSFLLDTFMLTPYFGLGYRYLNDDSSGRTSSTGARGYKRESNYYYSPIGVELIAELENGWFIGLTLEYDHFWLGVQKSHLSDADPAFDDLENDQNSGYGARGSLKLQKKGERIDFTIEPFIRYWNIKKSEEEAVTFADVIVGLGYEPKNNSMEIGGKASVSF